MKLSVGKQEQESFFDLKINEQIRGESIRKLLANSQKIENYSLNTDAKSNIII